MDKSRNKEETDDDENQVNSEHEGEDQQMYSSAKKSTDHNLDSTAKKKRTNSHKHVGSVVAFTLERGLSIEQQSLKTRVYGLINFFTQNLYQNVCRSILEKDKLLFSFLLTAKIRESQGKLNSVQYQLLIETHPGLENPLGLVNIFKSWLPNPIWNKLCLYASRDNFFDPLIK